MKLNETIEMMMSDDYKERFKAEYYQLKIRYESLGKMMRDWVNGNLKFKPTCPFEIYEDQIEYMNHYLSILEKRAESEGIKLL